MVKQNAKNVHQGKTLSKEVDIIFNSTNEEIASACIDCMTDVIVKKVGPNWSKSKKPWSLMVDCSRKISNIRNEKLKGELK